LPVNPFCVFDEGHECDTCFILHMWFNDLFSMLILKIIVKLANTGDKKSLWNVLVHFAKHVRNRKFLIKRSYSKTCEIRPPLGRAKCGLISEVVLFHRMGHTKQPNGPPSALQLKTTNNYCYLLSTYNEHFIDFFPLIL
jgi:hypothetical protein